MMTQQIKVRFKTRMGIRGYFASQYSHYGRPSAAWRRRRATAVLTPANATSTIQPTVSIAIIEASESMSFCKT